MAGEATMRRALLLVTILSLRTITLCQSEDIAKADFHLLAGERGAAENIVRPLHSKLFAEGRAETPEAMAAERIIAHADMAKHPGQSLDRLIALHDRFIDLHGTDHAEVTKIRLALADALLRNDRQLEARKIWTELGRQLVGTESRELATCYAGLGATSPGELAVVVKFTGDAKEAIGPQLDVQVTPSDEFREGEANTLRAIQMHKTLGGEDDPVAARIQLELDKRKENLRAAAIQQRDAQLSAIKRREHEPLVAITRERAHRWHAENPIPLVYLSTREEAEAYHVRTCSTIRRASTIEVPVTEAQSRHRRRPCQVCNPPGVPVPPPGLYSYRFDGRMHDCRNPPYGL
jgi:hypothetical protein